MKKNKKFTCTEKELNKSNPTALYDNLSEDDLFFDEIMELFPERVKYNLNQTDIINWKKTIDRLKNIDKFSEEDIYSAVSFARNDNFWRGNFLSIQKLRRKDKDGTKYIIIFLSQLDRLNNNY